jgi:sphingosine kinase
MAYMAPDANFFPAAVINDGLMDLITIDGDVAPMKAIQMQTAVSSGHFFDNPLVKYRKVSAYRIIPRKIDEGGYISIDGERIPFGPFQAEVHPNLGLVISKNGRYEAPGPMNWEQAHQQA